jgi:hypothetical protein
VEKAYFTLVLVKCGMWNKSVEKIQSMRPKQIIHNTWSDHHSHDMTKKLNMAHVFVSIERCSAQFVSIEE